MDLICAGIVMLGALLTICGFVFEAVARVKYADSSWSADFLMAGALAMGAGFAGLWLSLLWHILAEAL